MTSSAMRLKEELLRLPEEDRAALAHVLWDSLRPEPMLDPDEAEWIEELERRSADVEAGRVIEEPFRDVIAELRGEQP